MPVVLSQAKPAGDRWAGWIRGQILRPEGRPRPEFLPAERFHL